MNAHQGATGLCYEFIGKTRVQMAIQARFTMNAEDEKAVTASPRKLEKLFTEHQMTAVISRITPLRIRKLSV